MEKVNIGFIDWLNVVKKVYPDKNRIYLWVIEEDLNDAKNVI
jgi:hypothetical protein